MVEFYNLIAVGLALVIGSIPLMSTKLRGENFLVSYVRPDKYGEDEIKLEKSTPGNDVMKYIHPEPNSEVKVVSYNFPEEEYRETNWIAKFREWNKRGVKIKVVGGPDVKAKDSLKELINDGVIEVRLLKKPKTYHLVIALPRQLWIEEYHKDKEAKDCTFTPKPSEWVWEKANIYFDKLWEKGRPLT